MEAERQTLFISRARADSTFAATIGRVLETAGYRTILEQGDFADRSFMQGMHEALAGGARVVALLSPEYLKSDRCRAEWMNAIAGDPLNRNGRLVLLRVVECEPPGLLAGLAYWDLVPILDNRALLGDVVRSAMRGDHRSAAPIAGPYWRAPRTILDDRAIRPTPSFTGRETELAALDAALEVPGAGAVVHGLGGSGKSALAREYAWQHRERYAVVWWLNAADEIGIIDGLVGLGSLFARRLEQSADRREAARRVIATMLGGFSKPVLLIFDNLEDEGLLRAWHPRQGQGCRLLVTTRIARWGGDIAGIPLRSWSINDGARYLRRESGRSELTEVDARALAQKLHGLPLALAHAAAYLRENQTVRVQGARGYLARLTHHIARAPRRAEYPRAVFATFQAALNTAEREARGAAAVLCLASCFASEAIPEELFLQDVACYSKGLRPALPGWIIAADLRSTVAYTGRAMEALAALDRLSLIAFEGATRTFSLHPLVQAAGRDLLGDATLPWVQSAIAAAVAAFPGVEFATWPTCRRLLAHARTALDALPANEQKFASAARLANECGCYLHERAAFAEAEPLLRRALAIDEAGYGPNHPDVARDLNNLAQLLKATSRPAEAEPLLRRALAIDEASYGPEHPNVACCLNNLAQLLQATNQPAEAEPLMWRALVIAESSYGSEHSDVAKGLNTIARFLYATNRLAEAEPLLRRALVIVEASYGSEHPAVARGLNNLAQLLQSTNRPADAEPLLRRALAIDEAGSGPEHPNVAIGLNNLAQLLQATNRPAEAEPLLRRALAIDEAAHGPEHLDVAIRLNNLATLLYATNRPAEAEPLVRRALAIFEAGYGPEHPDVATCLGNLAWLMPAMNRPAEAEPLLRRALAIDEASYGPEHPNVAIRLKSLAQLQQATNRLAEAEPLYRRALSIFETRYAPDHPHVVSTRSELEALLKSPKPWLSGVLGNWLRGA